MKGRGRPTANTIFRENSTETIPSTPLRIILRPDRLMVILDQAVSDQDWAKAKTALAYMEQVNRIKEDVLVILRWVNKEGPCDEKE